MRGSSGEALAGSGARRVVVVGGGISGLAAAESLVRGDPHVQVTLCEAAAQLGGIVGTERTDGWVLERGPDVVVAAKPATQALCERLGIGGRLQGTQVRGAYVYRAGKLRRLPAGLSGLMPTRLTPLATSRLLSWRGLLRVAMEPWRAAPTTPAADESLETFVVRRLGREAYDRLVEPLLTGIYAGDGTRLSLGATFPQLQTLEREHGSLLRGLYAKGQVGVTPAASPFLSMPTGLGELVEALERALLATGRVVIRRATAVRAVRAPSADAPARVALADGTTLDAEAVILALPAPAAAALLQPVDPALAAELGGIALGSTATVTVGFARSEVPRALDATGYVVPRAEGRPVLACTWASSKLPGRAPEGMALMRLFLGGVRNPTLPVRDDAALLALARTELREVLGVTAAPRLVRIARWLNAMPQYELGHSARVARIDAGVAALPWLALAGNAFRGVGVPDCIRSGETAAGRALAHLESTIRPARPADVRAVPGRPAAGRMAAQL